MDFESTEGIGSSFYFELHLTSGKTTAIVDNYEDSTGSQFSLLNILLVEDDLVNQIAESAMLRQEGHQVTIANDGYVALEILKHCLDNDAVTFDLILIDIRMPAPIGTLPIIALTADVTVENISECYAAGIDKVLSKPINLQMLNRELRVIARNNI